MPAIDLSRLRLVTSNKTKLAEYRAFGLDLAIEPGDDLPEVDGTPDEVAIYKALSAGENKIVEDTILIVDGEPVVDIRWKVKTIGDWGNGKTATWEVRLGVVSDDTVHIYYGSIDGVLGPARGVSTSFDPYFYISGTDQTLAEMFEAGKKADYSARRIASERLVAGQAHLSILRSDIPEWTGRFQH